jgi:hypothetical protein
MHKVHTRQRAVPCACQATEFEPCRLEEDELTGGIIQRCLRLSLFLGALHRIPLSTRRLALKGSL